MNPDIADLSIEILEATNDGDDLTPCELKLVEMACNGFINGRGTRKLIQIHNERVSK